MQWLLLLTLSLLAIPAQAQTESVNDLITQILQRDDTLQAQLAHYQYHQQIEREKIDSDGQDISHSRLDLLVRSENDFTLVHDVDGEGTVPIQPSERDQKRIEESQKLKASFSLHRLAPRFHFTLHGKETLNGERALILAFTPKPNQPYSNRIEKILNQLTGKIWIRESDHALLQIRAHITHPVKMAWILVTMRSLDIVYQTTPLADIGPVPAEFNIDYRIGVLMGERRQRQRILMSDYQLKN